MSSSSSTITSTTVNGRTVISGLSSGIDVDSLVQQTIKADSSKLNRLKQKEQLAEWKQEAYRDIISDIQTFSSKYFDTTSSNNLMSDKAFQQYSITSSSSAVTASYTTKATTGTHTVKVNQLATAATYATKDGLSKDIQGSSAAVYSALSGKSFILSLDGTETTMTLDASVKDYTSLQSAIDDAVGKGKVTLSESSSGILTFTASENSGIQQVTLSKPSDSSASALSSLGFGNGSTLTNRIAASDTLETLSGAFKNSFSFNEDGQVEFSVNGVSFTFDKDTKLSEMISEVNNSDAGATLSYDDINDQLVLKASTTGAQKTLSVSETGSTFLSAALNQYTAGQDAQVIIDGQYLTRSSNTVTVSGVAYKLNKTTTGEEDATVTLNQDTDAVYNSIKGFVDDYNALIATINGKLSEEYDTDYQPLTQDQEDEMSDTEITNWNKKAKTGILEHDTILQGLLDDLRKSMSDSVSGQSLHLSDIGITTGDYDEKGKLYIDEDKLKEAIQSNPDQVKNLFTQQSSDYSGTATVRKMNSSERNTRYKQEGIAYRFYDILQDNISTVRDNNGTKGTLLEKAGMENDNTSTDNSLTDEINDYKDRIDKEQDRLDDEEDRLYKKYTAMEDAIQEMNNQLSSLQSYLSDGSGS